MNKNIIQFLCLYLDDLNSYRQCSTYLNKIIAPIYFKNKKINVNNINKNNKHKFRYFAHKYKLSLNLINVKNNNQLLYFSSYNIKSITFASAYNNDLYNLLPSSLQHLKFDYEFNQEIKENVLPSSLRHLKFGYNFNQKIKKNVLPSLLQYLELYSKCDKRKLLFNTEKLNFKILFYE